MKSSLSLFWNFEHLIANATRSSFSNSQSTATNLASFVAFVLCNVKIWIFIVKESASVSVLSRVVVTLPSSELMYVLSEFESMVLCQVFVLYGVGKVSMPISVDTKDIKNAACYLHT